MRVGPASPRADTRLCTFHDPNYSQRNSPEYFGGRDDHQSDVSVTGEMGRRHQLPESTVALVEEVNVHDW